MVQSLGWILRTEVDEKRCLWWTRSDVLLTEVDKMRCWWWAKSNTLISLILVEAKRKGHVHRQSLKSKLDFATTSRCPMRLHLVLGIKTHGVGFGNERRSGILLMIAPCYGTIKVKVYIKPAILLHYNCRSQ